MLTSERHDRIVSLVNARGSMSTDQLLEQLQVSKMTLWRDLKYLEETGRIRKVRGGAASAKHAQSNEPAFDTKTVVNIEVKRRLAQHAARSYVHASDTLVLEGGTTVAQIVEYIQQPNVTVLTHGLNTLMLAAQRNPGLTIMSCGGILRHPSLTFVGPEAEEFFSRFRVTTFFVSGTGISPNAGITDPNPLEIQVKRAMYRSASRVVALMDSSKFGQHSLAELMKPSEIDVLITDDGVPDDTLAAFRALGLEVDVISREETEY